MFLAILQTLTKNAAIHIAALDEHQLERLLVPFATSAELHNEYSVYSNGSNKIGGSVPMMVGKTPLEYNNGLRFRHIAKLSDLRAQLPKHGGGRPRKPTACKECGKMHPSYTEAKICCWKSKLEKKNHA